MGYEDKIAAHMERIKPVLEPGEDILLQFYGMYNISGFQFGGNPNLSGTWVLTPKRLIFTGKAGFSSGWSGIAKSGNVITIPLKQIVEMRYNKNKIVIIHTAEHEGKKPGAKRKVTLAPHQLKDDGTGKKEDKKGYIDRTGMYHNKLKELTGLP